MPCQNEKRQPFRSVYTYKRTIKKKAPFTAKAFFSKAQFGNNLDADQLIASFDEQMELE